MHPKFILVSDPAHASVGRFVYGLVSQHKELVQQAMDAMGYVKIHGGGWYRKDDEARTITLYGNSGDYGEPRLAFLNQIPSELRGYRFFYSPGWTMTPPGELDLSEVEWI